ncbi:MAG: hypothetical protein JWL81_1734 [Verrucomicrobiales bacterium]|nr:hypothetical protein [Verrucomicrobiales bacterium]
MSSETTPGGRIKLVHWARLHDRRHNGFFEALHREGESSGEDWRPMLRLLEHVRTVDGASRLFAFIFTRRLHLTTASGYADSAGHDSVMIGWNPGGSSFQLAFYSLDDSLEAIAGPARHAREPEAFQALDPLLRRLLERS